MPSWLWSSKSRPSGIDNAAGPASPASPTSEPWDDEAEDDEEVVAIIKSTNEQALRVAHAYQQSRSQPQPQSKKRSRRRNIPIFNQFAGAIPEELSSERGSLAQTQSLFAPGYFLSNSEDLVYVDKGQKMLPMPRRSSSKSALRDPDMEKTDLPLLSRTSDESTQPSSANGATEKSGPIPPHENQNDAEVQRLRKMCEVLQEKIIDMSKHTSPAGKRSSIIDRPSKSRPKDEHVDDSASEGHRVAQVMRILNEQLQKKLELRERLLFERNAHITQLERTHASQIEEFHSATKSDIQKMVAAYQKEISEMHARNLQQITNLRNELEEKIRKKENQNVEEKARLQTEINELKVKEAALIADHERLLEEKEVSFVREMTSLRTSIETTEIELQKNYDAKIDQMREDHEKEIADLKQSIVTRPLNLDDSVDRDIVNRKITDLEHSLATHLEELTLERERAFELQVALDASEFVRRSENEKYEITLKEETSRREDFQKHEQRIRTQLLQASDEKRNDLLKHERNRYERLVREENVRRKAASDRYDAELRELKQRNADQIELFRMQKESIFELHEKEIAELETKIQSESSRVLQIESELEDVKSSWEADSKRHKQEKADLLQANLKQHEAFEQERVVLLASHDREKRASRAEKETLETDLKRVSYHFEDLQALRRPDSFGSRKSRRSYTIGESTEDQFERRVSEEVAKVLAHSEEQQKASIEAYEAQTTLLKSELFALQKLQTNINSQVAQDEQRFISTAIALEQRQDALEHQANIISDLELQLESEKRKFKDILERNVLLEKKMWDRKETAGRTIEGLQAEVQILKADKQTLLATIVSAGLEGKEAAEAGRQLKAEIAMGYKAELQELETRHKEIIQNNVDSLYKLDNLVQHYAAIANHSPCTPSLIEEAGTVTDSTPSLTVHSTSSAASIRSIPTYFEGSFEPTFEPVFVSEESASQKDYYEALRNVAAIDMSKLPSDRDQLLARIQNEVSSFKLRQLSFSAFKDEQDA